MGASQSGLPSLGWPAYEGPYGVDEETQAWYLVRGMVLALTHPGVERFFWYEFRDSSGDPNACSPTVLALLDPQYPGAEQIRFGMVRRYNHTPPDPSDNDLRKPAFVAYRTLTQMLTGFDLQQVQVVLENHTPEQDNAGVYWYRFQSPVQGAPEQGATGLVDVFWRTGDTWTALQADYPCAEVIVQNWNGDPVATLSPQAGYLALPPPPQQGVPMYAQCGR